MNSLVTSSINTDINYNEEPKVYKHHDGDVLRTGYCCQCGQCCIDCPVKLLKQLSKDRFICSDRKNTYYLAGCNVWPTHPSQIVAYPKCTYKFEMID